jgi:ribosomal protein S18 acetylase RimI-like enzyme
MNEIHIGPAAAPEQVEQVRQLFREYAQATGACECFQDFARELAGLPGEYGAPAGQLLLADVDSRAAGCVALRRLEEGISEMKRLYVRPEFRGRRLGRRLAEAILAEARRAGYRVMRLDTLPSMTAAQSLYDSLGFRSIPRYNRTPGPGVIHLELRL